MKFTVIIPAYNIQDYISKSIKSVQEQTFKDIEIIVVDDFSKDNTVKEIEKFKDIKFIRHNKNRGLGAARNSGIEIANGEYIIFLDGDDYLHDEVVLEKLDRLINESSITPDVIYMGFQITGAKQELVIPNEENCTRLYKAAQDPYPNVWSKCWNTKFLKDNNFKFIEERYYEDVLFGFETIMKVKNYLIADFPVHTYVSGRKNSITTTIQFKNIYDTIDNIKDLIRIKKQEPTEEVKIKIQREIYWCEKRLQEISKQYKNVDC